MGAALAASEWRGSFASRAARSRTTITSSREALLRADLDGASLVLYEELPYVWGGSAARAARRAASEHGYRAHLESLSSIVSARQRLAATRARSRTSRPRGLSRLADVLPATERYWRLRRR